jgi:hypothetical protein
MALLDRDPVVKAPWPARVLFRSMHHALMLGAPTKLICTPLSTIRPAPNVPVIGVVTVTFWALVRV